MSDDRATFEQTKARLEEILEQVRRKDTSLEHSLELLEEGVRLANRCNELIDQTSWRAGDAAAPDDELAATADAEEVAPVESETPDEPGAPAEPTPSDEPETPDEDEEADASIADDVDPDGDGEVADPVEELEDDERS